MEGKTGVLRGACYAWSVHGKYGAILMYVYPLMYDSFDIFGLWFKRQTNRDGTI